jgi:hypothetical protein
MIVRCIALGTLVSACGGPAAPTATPPQPVTIAPATSSSSRAPVIAASATVPPTGDVDWFAQLPGGELFRLPGRALPFPLEAVKTCHARGRDVTPNEAGWAIVQVSFADGHFYAIRTLGSAGLAKSTVDCVETALNGSSQSDDSWSGFRATPLVLYVAMK